MTKIQTFIIMEYITTTVFEMTFTFLKQSKLQLHMTFMKAAICNMKHAHVQVLMLQLLINMHKSLSI